MAELVIALDMRNGKEALALARSLAGYAGWFKVGLELFMAAGPGLVDDLKGLGTRVFLDLKFYDIPNTVAGATRVAAELGVDMLTLHCQGGERMCRAARDALEEFPGDRKPLLFGVTALTSFAPGEMPGILMDPSEYGVILARSARAWEMDGVVCSGWEAASIKKFNPGLLCLCPGIRPAGNDVQDQRRTMTPKEAVKAGADFLVVGRPVTKAADPAEAVRNIIAEMG